jgi:hypothetical protein
MDNANVQERENLAALNQNRSESKIKNKEQKNPAQTQHVNTAEMIIVLGAAMIVDAVGLLDLTGFGVILTRIITFPAFGGLWLWRILKQQSSPKKDPAFQILIPFLAEISPFGILPSWTIYVIYIWIKDTKLGKATIGKAQQLNKIGK